MQTTLVRPARPATVTAFFTLAFVITWSLQLPAVLAQWGLLPGTPAAYMPLVMLGVFGPALSAVFLVRRESGAAGVGALLSGLRRWRVRWTWYVAALLLPGALLSAVLWALSHAGYTGPVLLLPGPGSLVAAVVIALGEEIGWRGFAQPRLQRRLGTYPAAGMIGVAWTLWHIPMFLGLGIPLSLLPVMLLFFVGGSLTFAWIAEGSGSLLLAVLAHVGAHLDNSHRALPDDTLPLVVHTVVYAGLGLLVASAALRRTRPRLSLTTERRQALRSIP